MKPSSFFQASLLLPFIETTTCFTVPNQFYSSSLPSFYPNEKSQRSLFQRYGYGPLHASANDESDTVAKSVTSEELEIMMTDFEQPLVIDAYATWYVPLESDT